MSHKPDVETDPQNPTAPKPALAPHPFLLIDDDELEPIQVELVDYPVAVEEPQFEALVADSQCEV